VTDFAPEVMTHLLLLILSLVIVVAAVSSLCHGLGTDNMCGGTSQYCGDVSEVQLELMVATVVRGNWVSAITQQLKVGAGLLNYVMILLCIIYSTDTRPSNSEKRKRGTSY